MEVVITRWALDSYLDLKHGRVFSVEEFQDKLKPDVLLLKQFPNAIKFKNGKFWSPVSFASKATVGGFKMKWHQVGNGHVQLRLPVSMTKQAFLCEAYVKGNEKVEKRRLAKFKTHIQLIRESKYKYCGEL